MIPVVKTPCSQHEGYSLDSLVRELRSRMPHSEAPKKKNLTSLLEGEEGITTLMPSGVYSVLDTFCISQGCPEKQNQWEIHFYYKEWGHTTVEADKFQDLQLAS